MLYPELIDGFAVFFASGGTAVSPQMVTTGCATEPSAPPGRPGYTFIGWYESQQEADEAHTLADIDRKTFDFSTPIEKQITLYGGWAPDQVKYTITYWLEKPNIVPDNYPEPTWSPGVATGGATIPSG